MTIASTFVDVQAHDSGYLSAEDATQPPHPGMHAIKQSTLNAVSPAETPSAPLGGGLSGNSDDYNLLPKTRPGLSHQTTSGTEASKAGGIQILRRWFCSCFMRGAPRRMICISSIHVHTCASALVGFVSSVSIHHKWHDVWHCDIGD